ncbi:MAG: TolC family protein [Gammaproteobacteria bacterium]|nr:TolC family protein [Gammaproteobacteria bacterium]
MIKKTIDGIFYGKFKALFIVSGCLITAAFCSLTFAESIVLDIDKAVVRAHNADPRIAEKERLVDVARGLLEEAQGAESWIFDVNAFLGLAPDVKGGIFENEDGEIEIKADALKFDGVSPWYNLQFSVVLPFYTFGKMESYSEAALNNIKVKQGDVSIERAKTYIDVVRAYYGFLAARDSVYLMEDANKKIDSAIELVQGWLDEGDGNVKQSDLYALQTGAGVLNRFLEQARGLQNVALAGLRFLADIPDELTLEIADKRIEPLDLPEESLQELQQRALQSRPELRQVEAGLSARRAFLTAKRAGLYPNLYTGVVGSFAYSPDRPRLDDIAIIDPFNHAGLTPVVGVKWNWWMGRQTASVTQAEGELSALIEKKSFAQRGIPFQVTEQFHQVHAHHAMVQHLYGAARAGRRWMISSFADFEAGVEESSKVVTAFQGYILAYGEYLRVVNDYNLHVARLRVATGEIQ